VCNAVVVIHKRHNKMLSLWLLKIESNLHTVFVTRVRGIAIWHQKCVCRRIVKGFVCFNFRQIALETKCP
jgi:hypothetical protein